jgi:putative hydrolase of the HAD superfamily
MTIFFDLDDTLVDSDSAHLIAIRKVCVEFSLTVNDFSNWLIITNKYLELYFENKLTLEEQRSNRIIEFWASNGCKIDQSEAKNIYNKYHYFFLDSCLCFNDTILTLEKIKHLQLGIITNGSYSDQIYKLKNNGLDHYFSKIIISEKVGLSKPNQTIFEIASIQSETPITECIYVGNSYEIDYLGALNAGMKAIWLDRNETTIDYGTNKINSLSQLVSFLSL